MIWIWWVVILYIYSCGLICAVRSCCYEYDSMQIVVLGVILTRFMFGWWDVPKNVYKYGWRMEDWDVI